MSRFVNRTSLTALALRAAWLKRRALGWVAALLLLLLLQFLRCTSCGTEDAVRVATFNIENYPKSAGQRVAALEVIRSTGALAIGVQEIVDPVVFASAARETLGPSWTFVSVDRPGHRVGVLFDASALELLSTRTYTETEVYQGAKPAFEARLRTEGGSVVRMIVVHLKAGGDGMPVRARQLRALAGVAQSAVASGDRVVLAGDFNATSAEDLTEIQTLARTAGLELASKDLPCSSYWNRRDGCLGVTLDHVLTSGRASVRAEGACETEGCALRPACPAYREKVSDHCPLTIDL